MRDKESWGSAIRAWFWQVLAPTVVTTGAFFGLLWLFVVHKPC